MIFSGDELAGRQRSLARALAEAGVDAAFIHTSDNAYYLTGVPVLSPWGRPLFAAIRGQRTAVIGARLEQENMERNAAVSEIRSYDDEQDVWSRSLELALDFIVSPTPVTRLGVELSLLPSTWAQRIASSVPGVKLHDVGPRLGELRLAKSPAERELLRLGGQIACLGASAFIEAVREGAPELAVAAHATTEMDRALAALRPDAAASSYSYCQVGDHTLVPHHHPTGRRIRRGDVVALNVFPVIWGYCMELERTFVWGEPTSTQARALAAVNAAFYAARDMIGPGVSLAEVDRVAAGILAERGYGEFIRHGTGHAHGIMIGAAGREEGGELRKYNGGRFFAGMVTSVEPGLYIPGLGGFRHSDVLEITADGATLLTPFPRDIP